MSLFRIYPIYEPVRWYTPKLVNQRSGLALFAPAVRHPAAGGGKLWAVGGDAAGGR